MACRTGRRTLIRFAAAGLSLLAMSGCSAANGDQLAAPRVIRLVATNFGYEPSRIQVHLGEEVRFILENPTDLPHEIFIGSQAEQAMHAAQVSVAGADVEAADAGNPAAAYVPARGVAQLVHRFENPEETTIGCHLTGHWESGMRATIVFVSP